MIKIIKMADEKVVECPVCSSDFKSSQINEHVNQCLNAAERPKRSISDRDREGSLQSNPLKRQKTSNEEGNPHGKNGGRSKRSANTSKPNSWAFLMSPPNKKTKTSATDTETNSADDLKVKLEAVTKRKFDKAEEIKQTLVENPTDQNKNTIQVNTGMKNDKVTEKSTTHLKSSYERSTASDGIPLPERMRPKSLAEYVGQEKVIGKNKLLRTLLEADRIPSIIIWGPPGCGKTTLARIIAGRCKESHNTRFTSLSATTAGIADVKEAIKIAKNELKMFRRRTVLFIDEIHRFNKLQQDTFLPHVEDGTISLIGATTENPSFQVNNALLSRCRVIVLEKLSSDHIQRITRRALGKLNVAVTGDSDEANENDKIGCIEAEALTLLSNMCDGDARAALNCLQMAVDSHLALSSGSNEHQPTITVDHIKEALQRSHVQYDRAGEEHYNCVSALQKSIRGSNDSGAIYWLGRMLEGGEDPLFIARRLVVTASEDIGLADPQALPLAVATFQACTFIGMPECAINLAHCTTYLARAAKSNESYRALHQVREVIRNHAGPLPGVPLHLRNAPTKLLKDMGYGKGYKYSHNYPDDNTQEYLPTELKNANFFRP